METQFKTVYQLLKDCQHFRTMQFGKIVLDCPVLDAFLQGGLPLQGINEIVGESGSGKTQLAMQLSCAYLQQINPEKPLETGVVYICTEDAFPVKRLRQMIDCRPKSPKTKTDIMDRLLLEHVNDVEELLNIIETKVPIMAERHNVKLIVIDSVAAVFRCENALNIQEKADKLFFLGTLLHQLNKQYEAGIVCINQVTDVVCHKPFSKFSQKRAVQKPSLGSSWSNYVTTRIMLSRVPIQPICQNDSNWSPEESNQPVIIRRMEILLSPNLPSSSKHFLVNATGVHGIQEGT